MRETLVGNVRQAVHSALRSDSIRSLLVRGTLLPLSGVASVLAAKVVTVSVGISGYGAFALLIALPAVVPISDFGIAAAVTDVAAKFGTKSAQFQATLRRVLSLLVRLACLGGLAVLGVTAAGWWPTLLGLTNQRDASLGALAVCAGMLTSIPLAAYQRVLLGVGRQSVVVAVQTLGSVLSALLCGLGALLGATSFAAYAALFAAGPVLGNAFIALLALRYTRSSRTNPGWPRTEGSPVSIRRIALPMAIISIMFPLAYQSDRIMLSQLSSLKEVAAYSLGAMLYFPLISIVQAGGQALWPQFMRETLVSPEALRLAYNRALLLFAALGAGLGVSLLLVGPLIAQFVAGEHPPLRLFAAFATLLFLFSISTPAGMLLMTDRGRVLQAIASMVLLGLKVAIGLLIIPLMGAMGSVVATIAALLVAYVIPAMLVGEYYLRATRRNS